ncbi:Chromatin assembly factor 1 subunit [Oleoguttula sp. CCFEE 5521]
MRATPLLVAWHDDNAPIYSAHFAPNKGRLATAGGDHNVRLWRIESQGEERKVTYLSTLAKHTQAVNVVRWCPRGETLASAGDDGNVLLWVPTENAAYQKTFGEDGQEGLESWRVKTMCRSSTGSEIYDLAWSPDGQFFLSGSMDNVARIYNATNGQTVRQIAEHNHYVQGVAWDPLNEYIATQSSDRSVHIYALKTKDGQFSLDAHAYNKVSKMDLPARRVSSNSPAPPDFATSNNHRASFVQDSMGSPIPSAPGTPQAQALAVPMNPPPTSHSRRSSFGSQMGNSMRRSVSPSPSTMPLPAVMPSASPSLSGGLGMGFRNTNIYANETFTSFFRRLTFTPDGSLLFTPAGQYKTASASSGDRSEDEILNTVYIYSRAGLNKPPVAHLPGHKKPSIAVKCSPVFYALRTANTDTREITIDTKAAEDIPPLPEPAMLTKPPTSHAPMDPPPLTSALSPSLSIATMASPRNVDIEPSPTTPSTPAGPVPAFGLPYRVVYAVATQDAVHVYDTQQTKPLCVVSNLHYATFTDLTWSSDGLTLLITSSDGFCSALTFAPGELGTVHHLQIANTRATPTPINIPRASQSAASTPQATPTTATASTLPSVPKPLSFMPLANTNLPPPPNPSPSPFTQSGRPASPARSVSASSMTTQSSFAHPPDQNPQHVMNNPTPSMSSVPSMTAAGSTIGGVPLYTPPQTPGSGYSGVTSGNVVAGVKRGSVTSEVSEEEGSSKEKRRRIAPTLVGEPGEEGK